MRDFKCGVHQCGEPVRGVYCPAHRARKMEEAAELIAAKSQRMKEMWETRGEELRQKIREAKSKP